MSDALDPQEPYCGRERRRTPDIDQQHLEFVAMRGGERGAVKVLRALGVDVEDSESVQHWHDERAHVRRHMTSSAQNNSAIKQSLITAAIATVVSFVGRFIQFPPSGPTH